MSVGAPPAAEASLGRNFTIVGAATLASRVTGFVRDMLVAATLGAGAVADAYIAAFLIPNLFRRLVGEGAFNAAYVPIFARRAAEEGAGSAARFAEAALSMLLALGVLILLASELLMPSIIAVVAPGFVGQPEKFNDAVAFGRIVFPFVAIIMVVAVFTATLNAIGRYAIAAWAPVLLNLLLIATLVHALSSGLRGTRDAGFLLVWTIVAAALLNVLIVAAAAWRAGYGLRPGLPSMDSDMRRLLVIALPGIVIAGAGHINVVVAAQLSSGTPSAVSWLYFAERIFQLPLGFVAAAIGVVLLPAVSRHLATGEVGSARRAESRALEFGLLVTLPAAIALAVLAKPIVSILYERGAFTAMDSQAVAAVLRTLAFGLPAFVLVKVFLPAFLAREELRAPIIASLAGVAVNVATALMLFPQLGAPAAAFGVTASAVANAGILYLTLALSGRFRLDALARFRLPRVLAATAVTGVAIGLMHEGLKAWMKAGNPFALRVLTLAALCSLAVAIHGLAAHLLRAIDLGQLRQGMRG